MDNNTLIFGIIALAVILIAVLFGKNVIAKFSDSGLEVRKKEGKDDVSVSDVNGGSTVNANTTKGQNLHIKGINEKSKININNGKKDGN